MKQNIIKKKIELTPTQIIAMGFFIVIITGALILNLPISSQSGESVGFINALFTATSAVCVTGLVVVNTFANWTLFGKIVIILLIQFGGLGFMTCTTAVFILLGKRITLKERLLIQESLNQNTLSGMVRLIRKILLGTLLVEGTGALLLAFKFIPEYGPIKGTWYSIFHSISAFCNAGFDIIGYENLSPYVNDLLINFTIMGLIIVGGIGFTVWMDIISAVRERLTKSIPTSRIFHKLSLHTKLALVITGVLILSGFIFFFAVEYNNAGTMGGLSLKGKVLASLFQSVSPRTAGFNTIPLDKLTFASQFMTVILMFIGGSPSGTAGGVKTVTAGVIMLSVISVIKGKDRTEAFERTIPADIIRKSLAVLSISLCLVVASTMLLTLSEKNVAFMPALFESTSAFATVGLTLNLTPSLTNFGKIIISMMMFIGRLGPITMVLAFSIKKHKTNSSIKLPEEKVIVG